MNVGGHAQLMHLLNHKHAKQASARRRLYQQHNMAKRAPESTGSSCHVHGPKKVVVN